MEFLIYEMLTLHIVSADNIDSSCALPLVGHAVYKWRKNRWVHVIWSTSVQRNVTEQSPNLPATVKQIVHFRTRNTNLRSGLMFFFCMFFRPAS